MTTIKSFTSLEQSRKLSEILPLESADMFWRYNHNIHTYDDIPKMLVVNNWDDYYNKLIVIMKWLVKLIDWFERETWWRRDYKRVTIDEKTTWGGRCLVCDAGTPSNKSIRCDMRQNRDCPCKHNQCLKYK